MSRKDFATENKIRSTIMEQVEKATRVAYIPPSHLTKMLEENGVKANRQHVARLYVAAGIEFDSRLGLWLKVIS